MKDHKNTPSLLGKIRNIPNTVKLSFLVSLMATELFTACNQSTGPRKFVIRPKGNLSEIIKDSLGIAVLKEENNRKLRTEIGKQIALDNHIDDPNFINAGNTITVDMDMVHRIIKEYVEGKPTQDKEVRFPSLDKDQKETLLEVDLINEPNGQREITEPYIKKHDLKPIKNAYELFHAKNLIQIGEKEFKNHFVADRVGNAEFKGLPKRQQKKYVKDEDGTYYELLFLDKKSWAYLEDLQERFNKKLSSYGSNREFTFVISSLTRSQSGQKNAGMNATESISAHNIGIGIDIEFKDEVELKKMGESADLYGLPILYYKDDTGERRKLTDPDIAKTAGKTLIETLNQDIQDGKILLITIEKQNGCLHIVHKAY